MIALVSGIAMSALTALAMWWAFRGATHPPLLQESGAFRLMYPSGVVYLGGLLVVVILGGALWMVLAFPPKTTWDGAAVVLLVVPFAGIGVFLMWEGQTRWVDVSPSHLAAGRAVRTTTHIDWRDVRTVSFSKLSGVLKLRAYDGRAIRINALMRGAVPFATLFRQVRSTPEVERAVASFLVYRSQYVR